MYSLAQIELGVFPKTPLGVFPEGTFYRTRESRSLQLHFFGLNLSTTRGKLEQDGRGGEELEGERGRGGITPICAERGRRERGRARKNKG